MSNANTQKDYLKAQELLPWYAGGKLSEEESSWVSQQLELHPALRDELDLIKKQMSLTNDYVNQLDVKEFENDPQRISNLLTRIQSQSHTSEEAETLPISKTVKKKSIWDSLASYLPKSQKSWQIAGALAFSIMVIQGVIITQLFNANQSVEYSTLSEAPSDKNSPIDSKTILLARFNLQASIFELDELLTKYNLNIMEGPDASGIYRLSINDPISDESIEQLISTLEDQTTIVKFIIQEN